MSYFYIDRERMKNKPQFYLCLPYPRRTVVRKLTEIYNTNLKLVLGKVHELSFDIPTKVERNHDLVRNELIDLFEGYYLVKMEWNGLVEYFVYVKGNRQLNNSGTSLSYKLYSTSYLIGKKAIPLYEETSKNLPFHATEFLKDTNWSLGKVSPSYITTFREITASQSNALQCIYDLNEKFECASIFDTVNQVVDFVDLEDTGLNKGMIFKEGITLESLGQEIDFDKIVTRLYVYGSDGLEFRRLSLVGVNYIQDLSWFIAPYQEDSEGNVLKHSKHLTDGFCHAYLNYVKVLEDNQSTFNNLTSQLTQYQDDKVQLESELASLQATLNQIENELWVINKTYTNEAPLRDDWKDARDRKHVQNQLIMDKESEIAIVTDEIVAINNRLRRLRESLVIENHFTAEQIKEMNNFIHHGYYTNDSITDEQDLWNEGEKVFKRVNQPPITISLGVANFLNDIRFEKIRDRISLGDTVKVKSEELDIYVSLKIIEINYNIDSDDLSLVVSNEKDLRDDIQKMVDEMYSSSHTSNVVESNKNNWNNGGTASEKIEEILNNPWDAAINSIKGGYKGLTTIDEYGLRSLDNENSNTFLFINNGVLSVTKDGADSIEVAIDKYGVRARTLYGEAILGNNLLITSENGNINIDGETITIKDDNGGVKVELGKYTDSSNNDVYGLNIIGGAFSLRTSTNSNEGTVIDGDGIKVYNSNGDIVFDTSNPDHLIYSGSVSGGSNDSIDMNGEVYLKGQLIFKDNTTGEGMIYYNNGNLTFEATTRFIFNKSIFLISQNQEEAIYINGKKVLTEP